MLGFDVSVGCMLNFFLGFLLLWLRFKVWVMWIVILIYIYVVMLLIFGIVWFYLYKLSMRKV